MCGVPAGEMCWFVAEIFTLWAYTDWDKVVGTNKWDACYRNGFVFGCIGLEVCVCDL